MGLLLLTCTITSSTNSPSSVRTLPRIIPDTCCGQTRLLSCIATTVLQRLLLPAASIAQNSMSWLPTSAQPKVRLVVVGRTLGSPVPPRRIVNTKFWLLVQLSEEPLLKAAACRIACPSPLLFDRLIDKPTMQIGEGGVWSSTLTDTWQVATLPQRSAAENFTRVVPRG